MKGPEVKVTRDEALKWLENALRNWSDVSFDEDDLEDVRDSLERFSNERRTTAESAKDKAIAELVEAMAGLANAYELICEDSGKHYHKSQGSYYAHARALIAKHGGAA